MVVILVTIAAAPPLRPFPYPFPAYFPYGTTQWINI